MVRSHTIEPKGIIEPYNEVDVRPYGFIGLFYYLNFCNGKRQKIIYTL
jgi:hypothetical protein